jgi:ribose transport system substrate-binding protein
MSYDRQRGTDVAIRLLTRLIPSSGSCAAAALAADLHVPRSSFYRISRILARSGLLDLTQRGRVRLGPLAIRLAQRRDEAMRDEDPGRAMPHPKPLGRAPATSHVLSRHAASVRLKDCRRFRHSPRFKVGFANADMDNPWQIALVHSVEYGAARHRDLNIGPFGGAT